MEKIISTVGLPRQEWLKKRKTGIGGSDAGVVCGLNPYSGAMQVYADKTSDEISDYDNEALRQGRDFEDYVAKRFMEETGKKVRRANALYRNEQYPFMIADVDRMIVGERAGLECKTVNLYNADQWKDGQIPPHYMIQCYHYMAVLDLDCFYIAALIFGKQFIWRQIERDEEMIMNLRTIEKDFWENHVMKRIPPAPDGSEASDRWIRQAFPEAEKSAPIPLYGFDERLERRKEVLELMKKLEMEKSQIEQELQMYLGDSEAAQNEKYSILWKNVVSSRLDTTRLKKEEPEVYQKFAVKNSSRRLTIKEIA